MLFRGQVCSNEFDSSNLILRFVKANALHYIETRTIGLQILYFISINLANIINRKLSGDNCENDMDRNRPIVTDYCTQSYD